MHADDQSKYTEPEGLSGNRNQCRGRVLALCPDGRKANITRQYDVQEAMGAQYRKNGGCLPLSLTFEEPKDYLAVVFYCVGDC